jgi:RNA polymerase sigma factor (sigma-70 family)
VSSSGKNEVYGCVKNNTVLAEEIFSLYGDFIRSVIQYQVKDANLADDLFQDFYLSLVARPVPPDVCNIKNYLYRAIVNESIDAIRRIEHYHGRVHRYSKIINNSVNKDLPENALIEAEETEKTFKMIESLLPHNESQAIALKFRDDSSVGETSKQIGVNKRSVSRYVSVGLKKLRKLLAEKEGI